MKHLSLHSILLLIFVLSLNFSFAQTAVVKFEVIIPQVDLKSDTSVFLAGSFNCWNPHDSLYIMKKASDNSYSLKVPLFDGQKYEYKYTLGDWKSVETTSEGEQTKNRRITSRDGLVITDTVLNWNSPQTTQKGISQNLNKEQIDMLSKLKDEISTKLESRMKTVVDVLNKANENMLSENPDMNLKKKYHEEILASIDSTVGIATDLMWKVSSMLTPEQRKEILSEMKNTDNPGALFEWMDKALEIPQE